MKCCAQIPSEKVAILGESSHPRELATEIVRNGYE
jgi:hypothetical protein